MYSSKRDVEGGAAGQITTNRAAARSEPAAGSARTAALGGEGAMRVKWAAEQHGRAHAGSSRGRNSCLTGFSPGLVVVPSCLEQLLEAGQAVCQASNCSACAAGSRAETAAPGPSRACTRNSSPGRAEFVHRRRGSCRLQSLKLKLTLPNPGLSTGQREAQPLLADGQVPGTGAAAARDQPATNAPDQASCSCSWAVGWRG